MLKYTLGFVYCEETSQVLLLNRQKKPWMGRWNGVGGKIDAGETPGQCIARETLEETGLSVDFEPKGTLVWKLDRESAITGKDDLDNGLYLFVARVSRSEVQQYATPRASPCGEGILDWKRLDWVLHDDNLGITASLRYVLPTLFGGRGGDVYRVGFRGAEVVEFDYLTPSTSSSVARGC